MLIDLVHQGLSVEFVDRLADAFQIERKVLCQSIGLSPAKMVRRKRAGRLSTLESDRLCALISVFQTVHVLFEGDVCAATVWANSSIRGLGSKTPLEMLSTRVEKQALVDLMGRLDQGVLV
ncbi:hypothetical protein D3C81_1983810 [compost metagenome]